MNIRYHVLIVLGIVAALTALPLRAAEPVDEARPAESDARIDFRGVTGDFEIIGHDANEILLSGTLGDDVEELVIDGDRDHWRVELEMKKGNFGRGGRRRSSELRLLVPRGAELDVKVVSADLTLRELDGASVDARTVSGRIELAGVVPQELRVQSVSGAISADAAGTRVNRFQTVSGDIDVSRFEGRFELETVSGDAEIGGESVTELGAETVSGDLNVRIRPAARARIELTSHSGGVSLALPSDTELRLRAETFSGSIDSDLGGEVESGRGPGERLSLDSGGGVEVETTTFSGSVRIRRLD